MRTNEELKTTSNLIIDRMSDDGGTGRIIFGKLNASVVWSNGAGWDHISVAPFKKHYIPSWEEMCKVKNMFFYPDEIAVQFHPAESEYVNNVGNCLHLWRPQNADIPTPPPILVGMLKGMSRSQFEKEIEEAYKNPYRYAGGNNNG